MDRSTGRIPFPWHRSFCHRNDVFSFSRIESEDLRRGEHDRSHLFHPNQNDSLLSFERNGKGSDAIFHGNPERVSVSKGKRGHGKGFSIPPSSFLFDGDGKNPTETPTIQDVSTWTRLRPALASRWDSSVVGRDGSKRRTPGPPWFRRLDSCPLWPRCTEAARLGIASVGRNASTPLCVGRSFAIG